MPDLHGHAVVVTGGSTLVGHGVVRAAESAGASVAILDIDPAGARVLVDELGERVSFHHTDIGQDADVRRALREVVHRWGSVDGLVNLACVYDDEGPGSTRDQWASAFNVNVAGTASVTLHAQRHLRASGRGSVVNITSISSGIAQTGRWVYPATKAALVQLTRSMAMDLAPDGIRVNSVSPGWTWSSGMAKLTGGDRSKVDSVAAPFHLIGRACDPVEVGAVVTFLLSPAASGVTGADWAVDGGYSAMGPEQAMSAISGLVN